jgi:asparagine N-glycosylation enzyme membrane subunit Stt3
MAVTSLVLGLLLLVLLVLAARFASGRDHLERGIAAAVLGVESLAAIMALGFVAAGDRGRILLMAAAALPILVAATWVTWPRRGEEPGSRVQRPHG